MSYYAIETTSRSFLLKQVIGNSTYPVDGIAHTTLEEAQRAADKAGIEIKTIGTSYQIIGL